LDASGKDGTLRKAGIPAMGRDVKKTAIGVALLVAAAWPGSTPAGATEPDRSFSILAVEHRAYRHVDRTPYPAHTWAQHPDLDAGGGYRLDPPDENGEWYVRAYAWSPGTIVVQQGETVMLEFFGINGDFHPSVIEGYDLEFDVRRGEITRVTFTADRPGLFRIVSLTRLPSMVAQLVVMPAE
jgi:hypothetical protein